MSPDLVEIEPGVHELSEAAYHADPCPAPSLSNSIIKLLIGKSPRHAWMAHPRLNAEREQVHTSDFDFGAAAHAAVLEGRDISVVVDAADWRTKAAQAARDDARAAGLVPLLPPQHVSLQAMVAAARAKLAAAGLQSIVETGSPESTIVWHEGRTWCRGRLDLLSRDRTIVLDYKTTNVANPAKWIRGMTDLGYDTQSVFYPRGLRRLGYKPRRFIFLVQETAAPHCCYLVELAESMAHLGELKVERAINLWGQCVETNTWPAYGGEVYMAEAPPWELTNEGITE